MIKAAIVEDDRLAAGRLQELLGRYAADTGENIETELFANAVTFLNGYRPRFDVVFMDIQMPHMDGMEAAAKFREVDSVTILVFVTNMAHLAARGYEVEAFDFVVKPLAYDTFRMKMDRLRRALDKREAKAVTISSDAGKVVLDMADIIYVEVMDHRLIYHTEKGDYSTYGSISKAAKELENGHFSFCNSCYLVNLKYVKRVQKYSVFLKNSELAISRPRKKQFMEDLNNYLGE